MTADNKPIKSTPRYLRVILIAAGTFFLAAGVIGIFVPVLPTTPFLLLAAACYARSSPRLYNWILTNRWFGKYIDNYLKKKGIPLRIKIYAISLLWLAIGFSVVFAVELWVIRIALVLIAAAVTAHLISIKTIRG